LNTIKRKYFFVESEKDGLKELIYRVRVSGGEMQKDEQYKNLISIYSRQAGTDDLVGKQLETTDYTDKDLLRLFNLLNGGKGSFKETTQMQTRFDLSAGGSLYVFSTAGRPFNDGSGAYAITSTDFKSSIGFIAGCGITYYSKRNRGRFQSRLGLNIASITIDGENTTGDGSFDKEKYSGSIIMAEPNLSFDVLLTPKKQSDLLLGVFFGYNLPVINNFTSTFENPGVVINRENFPPVSGGFIIAGINGTYVHAQNRINLRLFSSTNVFDSPLAVLRGTGISLSYGYIFKKKSRS
jgi:hypothetical protein